MLYLFENRRSIVINRRNIKKETMFSNFFKKNKTEETIVNVKETQQPVQQPAEQPLQKESPNMTIIA